MNRQNEEIIANMQKITGWKFSDPELILTAVTHSSYVKGESKAAKDNERLEFLGDSILGICVSEWIYKTYSKAREGKMTRVRSLVVSEAALCKAAKKMQLGENMRLSRGEERTGGRDKSSILADAVEAVIGALYLDGGFEEARRFVLGFCTEPVQAAMKTVNTKDYKTTLQEHVQKHKLGEIKYVLIDETGPDHIKKFNMAVMIDGETFGTGCGSSKQEAGQIAAREALVKLKALGSVADID